ncbi:hypothetical protein [Streptomyces cremeus]|uniref:Uncharacterized protein n=1 Tax=Streptomyces cremeus TaxID=66881 RepID=A0ABV5P5G6_STRCM
MADRPHLPELLTLRRDDRAGVGRHGDLTTGITDAAAEGSNHLIKVRAAAGGRLRAAGRSNALHAHRRY